jgi:hypothetical protein
MFHSGTSGGAVALLDVARHDYHKRLRAHTGDISVLLRDPNAQRNQFASGMPRLDLFSLAVHFCIELMIVL